MRANITGKNRGELAEELLANLFRDTGWEVNQSPGTGLSRPDFVIRLGKLHYLVEVKAVAEARGDRVLPVLSQAILQAQAKARQFGDPKIRPLAVTAVERASDALARQIESFAEQYAPDIAVGLVSHDGLRFFRGEGLDNLNANRDAPRWSAPSPSSQSANLFSDLNQWMLKLLLAPEIPEGLLRAPRNKYRSGSELADAAGVSAMSASRFLQQLRAEGYLDSSARNLAIVRRRELFHRWQNAMMRFSPELPMRFLIRGPVETRLKNLLVSESDGALLGLFGAANALGLGHVIGVPPCVFVTKLPQSDNRNWRALAPAPLAEVPDIVVRQSLSPKSAFRGAVSQDGFYISDVIQTWLDVSNHPSRGREQADLIYEKVFRSIVGD